MSTVRDRGVVWCGVHGVVCQQSETEVWCEVCEVCKVCQQSETEVWCGVRCVS